MHRKSNARDKNDKWLIMGYKYTIYLSILMPIGESNIIRTH